MHQKNDNSILPLTKNSTQKIVIVSVGDKNETVFNETINKELKTDFDAWEETR